MIRTYFKSDGRLFKVDIDTSDPGIAQVETYLLATAQGVKPDTTVLAVIHGGGG